MTTLTVTDLAAMGYRVEGDRAIKVKPVPRLEKAEMRDADYFADKLGFRSVHFSQPRASKQTPGIPDRLYLHRATRASFWWEAKAEGGRVSAAQEQMHDDLRASGQAVVVGTAAEAIAAMRRIIAND